jgi:flagellar motor switch protein FliN
LPLIAWASQFSRGAAELENHVSQNEQGRNGPESGKAPSPMGGLSNVAASLSKVPVKLQVLLGAAHLQLSELLALKSGSDVRLDARPGEPVTLLVNGCSIARGELYIIEEEGDRFGVKITELFESSKPA